MPPAGPKQQDMKMAGVSNLFWYHFREGKQNEKTGWRFFYTPSPFPFQFYLFFLVTYLEKPAGSQGQDGGLSQG